MREISELMSIWEIFKKELNCAKQFHLCLLGVLDASPVFKVNKTGQKELLMLKARCFSGVKKISGATAVYTH